MTLEERIRWNERIQLQRPITGHRGRVHVPAASYTGKSQFKSLRLQYFLVFLGNAWIITQLAYGCVHPYSFELFTEHSASLNKPHFDEEHPDVQNIN